MAGFAAIYIIWGSTYLAIRVAVETMPPLLMAGGRFIVAGILLGTVLKASARFHATWQQWRDNIVIGAFMLLGGNGLVVWAEQQVPSGIATLVISLNPIFIVLAEWLIAAGLLQMFSKKASGRSRSDAISHSDAGAAKIKTKAPTGSRPNWLTIVGLVLGFVGLGLLVWPALVANDASRLDPWRILALVLACISWTIGSLANRNLREPADPFTGAAIQMIGGGMWLTLAGLMFGEPWHYTWSQISVASWIAWIYLLIAGSLIAFTTFIWLMKHCSPTIVSTYAYVNPIVAVFLGWLILNEDVGARIFAAAAIIVGSVAVITWSKQRK